ncbi:DUF411 domain-containing protein [Psychromonas ossibalaenae]|uniref:DUF411 domain-containing protein n=1 Tax=Psychromonas ossibalaenae TaxID=444922 RepID=UPI00036A9B7E|nr:DUF411 domain-containing protein [Psychromonas ossibalaenae]
MNKLKTLFITLSLFAGSAIAADMTMYKSPYCGCCTAWAEQLEEAGFEITVIEQANNNEIRQKHGITPELMSCHTAEVGGYALEGHVPPADIKRMLKEKPAIAGLAVPGMPASSPGMDVPGNSDPYQVVAFTKDGKKMVYNQYNYPEK